MKTVSFYHAQTGIFNGRVLSTDDPKAVQNNTPSGYVAIEGAFDSRSQRFDVSTGKIIAYQPPSPSPDHEWNEAANKWVLKQSVAQLANAKTAARTRIAALLESQSTVVRKHLLNGGAPATLDRLRAIDEEISALEDLL